MFSNVFSLPAKVNFRLGIQYSFAKPQRLVDKRAIRDIHIPAHYSSSSKVANLASFSAPRSKTSGTIRASEIERQSKTLTPVRSQTREPSSQESQQEPFAMPPVVGSASFYPIQGLFYIFRKESRALLVRRVAKFAAELGAASVAIFGALVGFTFKAQCSVVLRVVPHFFGTPVTIAVILMETAVPITYFFYQRLNRVQDKLFDDVLSMQGIQVEASAADEREWIEEQREIQWKEKEARGKPSVGRMLMDPMTMNDRPLTKYLLTLPLNFVPVAGTAAFCWINSMDLGSMLHHHYYSRLKGLSSDQESTIVRFRMRQYQQFGLTAALLTLIPGVNVVLVLTNSIGAALWAADLEKAAQKQG